jgi:hypothetical protein
MAKSDVAMIRELGRNLDRFAGQGVREKVMEGSEGIIATSSKKKLAEWVKGAIDRMDALVDRETRIRVMENCGRSCAHVHQSVLERAKARRGARS